MITSLFLLLITIHWGFATGAILTAKTNWSIPRFLIILLLFKYLIMSYAIQNQ
jgi:hypothetical protein